MQSWPYPRWIAHRGAGKLAPENTLAAFRLGASHGWRMFECDVKLSADDVPFLLHDRTLERTTDGRGPAGERSWAELSRLDAGSWHSPAYAGEPLLSLETLSRWCLAEGMRLNVEIKPSPGAEARTGERVAAHAAALWKDAPVAPLLSSFNPVTLQAARDAAPALPRALLLDRLWDGWETVARTLGCVAIVCERALLDGALVRRVQEHGWRCLSYTVNDPAQAQRLLADGIDGLITDRVDFFRPQ